MQLKPFHSICVAGQNNQAASLYGKVSAYLSKGYAVIYAVETTVTDTMQRMNDAGIRSGKYIGNNALTILDRNSVYSQERTKLEGRLVLETWKEIISKVNQKGNFKGIAVMGMPEPFFEKRTANHQKLVEYEELVSREFDGSFEAICCYRQESVADLPLEHLISLLNSHQYTLTGVVEKGEEEEYSKWHATELFVLIVKGLEKAVGKATAKLIFGALQRMHNIDERMIVSYPGVFENTLRRMFADSAETILDAIKHEIITDILFGQTSSNRQRSKSHENPKQEPVLSSVSASSLNFLLCPFCYWSATAIVNWKPEFCPVCHNTAIRSHQMRYANADSSSSNNSGI